MKLDPVTIATPFFIVAVIAEILLAKYNKADARYEAKDTRTSLFMGLGSTVTSIITGGVVGAATLWVFNHRAFTVPLSAVWAWVLLFLLEDLTYYWFHRISHERRLWWASHIIHHSSQHYNLSTALRQTWTGDFAMAWVLWLPLAYLGFSPWMIATQKGISLVYQFWIHTETIRRLPKPVEFVMNTPSHHRVHHARNPRYLDANYAGILIIWDRMFGTFVAELDEDPCRYGIVKNLGDFNIARVAFHEWIAIGRDVKRSRSLREVVGYVFGPPGWSHDGSRDTSIDMKRKWIARTSKTPAP